MAAKAAKAKAAAKRAAAKKASPVVHKMAVVPHDPTRPPPLSPQDQTIFKKILHQYEEKQYSAALLNCNELLSRYPDHGETTAMAGLLHHSLQDKQKGYALVRAGIKADLKSHIVWHVYGIITRADQNYAEAVKSYGQALRLEPENSSILRDLAVLQIQMRMYGAYVESRWRMLRFNKRSRTAWISLAVAYALNEQADAAIEVLDAMEGFEVTYEPERCFERSELVLFRAAITSPPAQALEYLEGHSTLVLDRPAYLLARARLLTELGRAEAAEWAWLDLLDGNSESRAYLEGYTATRTGQRSVLDVLTDLLQRYPDSKLIQRTILDHANGEHFERELETYLSTRLSKGIPSVFNDLKPLLSDPIKANVIRTVAERLRSDFESVTETDSSPSAYLWVLHFLAQLYSSRHFGLTTEALEVAQLAIQHTPTLPDLYLSLAHVYKRAGAYTKAAETLRVARELDGQDRYLNSKCAKYILRSIRSETERESQAKLLTECRRLAGLYTRKDAPDPVSDLVDMQAIWYVIEEAEVGVRVGDWGVALKRFHQIVDIFRQWEEDQYDFHVYCMRKSTLRTYNALLGFEDTLYSHPQYFRAVSQAIKIYLTLHDRRCSNENDEGPKIPTEFGILAPPEPNESTESQLGNGTTAINGTVEAGMSKKALKKAKMVETKAKAQAALEAKRAMSKMKGQDGAATTTAPAPEVVQKPKDDDPIGEKLVKTDRPLELASELLKPMEVRLGQGRQKEVEMEVWILRFEIELRRDKPLLALRALLKARASVEAIKPKIFLAMSDLQKKMETREGGVEKEVVSTGLESLLEEVRVKQHEEKKDGEWRLAFEEDLEELLKVDSGVSWELSFKAWEKLGRVEEFRKLAAERWILAEEFQRVEQDTTVEKVKEGGLEERDC
ncbi:hypothetical protein CROQUDRAFT_662352 [Cronartium quercuum f. sp. fusiforme G11]|uniref:Uncharacterized protein n=1 Tax=Cronartium quercuum f. sp. fusiforme G11 TaxID=708437 RepID=A0A9P6NE39_9BASI|nr:hypothetical protein CROQUDRAFT_662352 [Cronartium quercuum f. sp. fusiforme G11]